MNLPRLHVTISPHGIERVEADADYENPEIREAAMRLHKGIGEALIALDREARSACVWANIRNGHGICIPKVVF